MSAIHHLIGMGSDQLLAELLGHDNPAAVEARTRRYQELMGEAKALPGAVETLAQWHRRGLVVVIASSSPLDELDAMLALLDAGDAVDATTSADDVDRSKPHPDVFEAALRSGAVDPARAVVIGDSVWDVHAARRVGLPMLGVESGGIGAADLLAAGARRVYRDVGEMGDGSPWRRWTSCTATHAGAGAHRTGSAQAAIN